MNARAEAFEKPETAATPVLAAGKLINIDNGGTLTDICVIDSDRVYRTKTVTTPYDLSKCLFEGLKKASRAIYGEEDLQKLLLSTEYIRYSTTQGTNALVERKGPRLGLMLGGGLSAEAVQADPQARELFQALVGTRVQTLDPALAGEALDTAAMRAVTALSSAGANRIVVVYGGAQRNDGEVQLKKILLRRFPPQMLGALPVLYSHELVDDADDARRAWTSLFNAFLHPAMERFLYSAEHRLREYKTKNPLLIFRNDGFAARVARTVAIKTYSSGPRGGAEGAKALAAHYGFKRLLSMDVGGTTTDIGLVEDGQVRTEPRGRIEGVATSFPLCDVASVGVGGSSIIRAEGKRIAVGPESVGGAPGPACFGLGGKEATITDAFLLTGLLDPASYFGGELKIDAERARSAIAERVAKPLGVDELEAACSMEAAWVAKIADSLKRSTAITKDTTLAAFGGAGPFVVCKVAEATGIDRVIIPGLAAVFSAYGIGFSDIGHTYEIALATNDDAGLEAARAELMMRAQRGMFAEGASLDECRLLMSLLVSSRDGETLFGLEGPRLPAGLPRDARITLQLKAIRPIAHTHLEGGFGRNGHAAQAGGARRCRVEAGWRFEINESRDVLLRKS